MTAPARPSSHVLGVDSGGSGIRVALAPADGGGPSLRWSSPVPTAVGPAGVDARGLLAQLLPAARELLGRAGAGRCEAVCVGATGMAGMGDELRAVLPAALREALGTRRLALASDAVTAYVGALGQRPGVVVAAGTGLVALGTDLSPEGGWRRADGWGHLLGDCGGGAWIGRAGLEAAMRAHDGRAGGSRALLDRLRAVFGPAERLPGLLYPRADRPALLASFAPEVAVCAAADPVAAAILREAAWHIAGTAAAACPPPGPPSDMSVISDTSRAPGRTISGRETPGPDADGPSGEATEGAGVTYEVALVGGLFRMGDPLLAPVREELQKQLPHARPVDAAGEPLDGALRVAGALVTDSLLVPADPAMLRIIC
ncbi:N-acetylglucosamine kinase [Streptomyces albireticuli]|uniref:ATPase n=1 Tax=Streptomyces albireticuli TaxID=1940 RepID=A0A2A2DC81_9ACTN|nr:BadF/BadG/BcrA/BcrD ATPase family protein [Streptomyces albireticuli]MCD9141254.1 ATPase [Streptomyces albireticuli]MCD9160785.1 ATPase [Streptomyces albireticuli]MCD9191158.1 ATPase [Streptomyces albireticuli]PAU49057.1 ATPase [Streptomyces albireticuli]